MVAAYVGRTAQKMSLWECRCDCGNKSTVQTGNLTSGNTTSCGCYWIEVASHLPQTHGMTNSPEYTVWCEMIRRCEDKQRNNFKNYGGRGITVCSRWRKSFSAFFEDMGAKPTQDHSIERENNDGNYEPGNCRWATRKEQGRNTRANRLLEYNGRTACLSEWAEVAGLSTRAFHHRLSRGWSVERAITTPNLRKP